MYLVNQITDDPLQTNNIILPDGTTILLTMNYIQQQYGWFFNKLIYNTFEIDGMRICTSPNMLHQYRNLLPFGLACYCVNFREPTQLEDFASGAAQLYVLTADEVKTYAEFVGVA